jgi:hypothetical protein
MTMNDDVGKAYMEWCRFRLMKQYWPRVQRCVEELSNDDLWWRAHDTNNSVGNLILHLTGNLRQFILAAVGGAPDTRNRVQEFAEREHLSKEQLMQRLSSALVESDRVLAEFDPVRLLTLTKILDRERPYLEVIATVVEHFALHVGQMIYIAKMRTGKELKF